MSTIRLRPAEAILAGHPDRLADTVADALVGAAITREPRALVGVEVAVHRESVFLTGRINGAGLSIPEVEEVVRGAYAAAGYDAAWGPSPEALRIVTDLDLEPLREGESELRELAADQAISIGYAVARPETEHLPPEHWLARRIARELTELRRAAPELGFGPDGKVAVLCAEHAQGSPLLLRSVNISLQQRIGVSEIASRRAIGAAIRSAAAAAGATFRVPADVGARLHFNRMGDFELGGPRGDNGLSGKKLVVDAYGPRVPIGGGAFSGKDFYTVDRAGAIGARALALAALRSGEAREVTVELLWHPGDRTPAIAAIVDGSGAPVNRGDWVDRIDLTLRHSGHRWPRQLGARLAGLAVEGHFGTDRPWERHPRSKQEAWGATAIRQSWCGTRAI